MGINYRREWNRKRACCKTYTSDLKRLEAISSCKSLFVADIKRKSDFIISFPMLIKHLDDKASLMQDLRSTKYKNVKKYVARPSPVPP